MSIRTAVLAAVAATTAMIAGCSCAAEIPEGRFRCVSDADCPPGWTCRKAAPGDETTRCFQTGLPGMDGGVPPVPDAGPPIDADSGPPPDPDGGAPDAGDGGPPCPGGCSVEGRCYAAGERSPLDMCKVCDPASNPSALSQMECLPGDLNPCTSDACNSSTGRCETVANGDACDDTIFCNGEDSCAEGGCNRHTGDPCEGTSRTCFEAFHRCENCGERHQICCPGGGCDAPDVCAPDGVCHACIEDRDCPVGSWMCISFDCVHCPDSPLC